MFTEDELTLFVNAVNGVLSCDPDVFLADVRAALDDNQVYLMARLESLPPTNLAELASRCRDFWKLAYRIPNTRTRLFEVGLPQNFGSESVGE